MHRPDLWAAEGQSLAAHEDRRHQTGPRRPLGVLGPPDGRLHASRRVGHHQRPPEPQPLVGAPPRLGGLRTFKAGKLVETLLYQDMQGWAELDDALSIDLQDGTQKAFTTPEGGAIADRMTEHAAHA